MSSKNQSTRISTAIDHQKAEGKATSENVRRTIVCRSCRNPESRQTKVRRTLGFSFVSNVKLVLHRLHFCAQTSRRTTRMKKQPLLAAAFLSLSFACGLVSGLLV